VLVTRAAQGDKTAMRQLMSLVQPLPEELFVDRTGEVYEMWMERVRNEARQQFRESLEKLEAEHPEWFSKDEPA
jgi:hypothetical protein